MLPGGIDVFYIDESHDAKLYVVTALAIPFLRPADGGHDIAWKDQFEATKHWRREMAQTLTIPVKKELHGVKLASGRGNFKLGRHNFDRAKASSVYRQILRSLTHLPQGSLLSVCAERGGQLLYGNDRLKAAMYALFQRMRTQCEKRKTNAIVFFDQGHPEYRQLYRQAQVYLPTGSMLGTSSRNLPLSMFVKDGNEKSSSLCRFTQIADIVAYAAFLKRKAETNQLTDWQQQYNLGGAV